MSAEKVVERENQSVFAIDDHLSDVVENIVSQLKKYLPEQSKETALRCVDLCKRNEFVIMVAGEISVGKSSFLNALMGNSILLTDTTETTAAITYLRTAEGVVGVKKDHVKITYKNKKEEWIPIGDIERLKTATTSLDGNETAISRVLKAEVFCSKETLDIPLGITIIDTPGLNGSDSHAELTHREMGLCHAALFLLDASKFGTLSNKEEFRRLYRYAPEVLFVVNKWDLVRSTGANLEKMKQNCFESLGNWADVDIVSNDNIFIISGQEALIAKELFEKIKKDTPKDQWKNLKLVKQLPYPDNEYFLLEGKISEIMQDKERIRMIRKRPLMTLLLLAKDCIDEYQEKLRCYEGTDKEFEEKIRLETRKIELKREDSKKAFSEVRDYAKRLSAKETQAYRACVEEASKKISKSVNEKIKRMDVDALRDKEGQSDLSAFVKRRIEEFYRKPIFERLDAFVRYVQNLLESNTKVRIDNSGYTESTEILKNDFNELDRERKSVERKMAKAGTKRDTLLLQIEEAENEIDRCEKAERSYHNWERELEKLEKQLQDAIQRRADLGAKPRPKVTYEQKEVTVRREGGFFRKLFSLGGILFDSDTYETEYQTIEKVDNSNVREWQSRYDRFTEDVDAKKRERDRFKNNRMSLSSILAEKAQFEKQLKAAERELNKINDELNEQNRKIRSLGNDNVRLLVQEYWTNELKRVKESFESSVEGFATEIDRLVENFWKNSSRKIDRNLKEYIEYEKSMNESRKKASDEYASLQKDLKKIIEIRTKIEKELEIEQDGVK